MSKSIIPGIVFKLPSTLFDPTLRICVHNLDNEVFYCFEQVSILEASGSDTKLYFNGCKDFVLSSLNLKVYDTAYCPLGLVRVSQQHIVNPRYIERISHTKKPVITMRGFSDIAIPVSESGVDKLRSRFGINLPQATALDEQLAVALLQATWLQNSRFLPFRYFR